MARRRRSAEAQDAGCIIGFILAVVALFVFFIKSLKMSVFGNILAAAWLIALFFFGWLDAISAFLDSIFGADTIWFAGTFFEGTASDIVGGLTLVAVVYLIKLFDWLFITRQPRPVQVDTGGGADTGTILADDEYERALAALDEPEQRGDYRPEPVYLDRGRADTPAVNDDFEYDNIQGSRGKYTGDMLNGSFDGHGTYVTDRYKYVGEWSGGVFHGHGTLELADSGATFEGEFADGKRHGPGVITYPDGSQYQGRYRDDMKHGKFTYTDGGGNTWFTFWENGRPAHANERLR